MAATLRELIGEAMAAGALGLSTTTLAQHIGYQGTPLACRLASKDELKSYANVLKSQGKGSIELAFRIVEDAEQRHSR